MDCSVSHTVVGPSLGPKGPTNQLTRPTEAANPHANLNHACAPGRVDGPRASPPLLDSPSRGMFYDEVVGFVTIY
jgi:hypothetical protein